MKQLSLIDKFKVVMDITNSDKTYIVVICLLAFLSILFATTNRKNAKESKKTYGIIYIIALIAIIIKYHASLSTMYDNMMNNLFIVFYFPNISVYLAAIIATNIIMWVSMFSKKTKTLTKIVNSVVFFSMHYLLVLLLSVITNNNLNVFSQTSLYSNTEVHSLIELSSNIFIVWIIYLVIYKILRTYFENKALKTKTVTETVINKKEVTLQSQSTKMPYYINTLSAPYTVKREESKTKVIYQTPTNANTAIYDQMLTLEDYKVVLSMLREQQQQESKQPSKNNISEDEAKIEEDNEKKLSELMELYRSV